jgi:hypothetical protein
MSNGVVSKPAAQERRDGDGTAGTLPSSAARRPTRTLLQRLIRGVLVLASTFVTIILAMTFGPATPWVSSSGPMLLYFFIAVFVFGALTPPIFPDRVRRPFRQAARGLVFAVFAMLPVAAPAAFCYLFTPWLGLAMLGLGAIVIMPMAFWAGFIGESWSSRRGNPKRLSRTGPSTTPPAATSAASPTTSSATAPALPPTALPVPALTGPQAPTIIPAIAAAAASSAVPSPPAIALAATGQSTSIAADPGVGASAISPIAAMAAATSAPAQPAQTAPPPLPSTPASFSLLWTVKDNIIVRRPTGALLLFRWLLTAVLATAALGALALGLWQVALILGLCTYPAMPGGGQPGAWVGRCPTCKGEVVFPDPTRSAILTPIKRLCPTCSAPIEIVRDRFIAIPDTGQRRT